MPYTVGAADLAGFAAATAEAHAVPPPDARLLADTLVTAELWGLASHDVLAGVLTGSAFGSAVVGPYRSTGRSGVGHLLICVDIRSMADPATFEARMEALIEETKSTPTAPGTTEILVPGEPEIRTAERLRAEGITLADDTWTALTRIADATGVPLPPPAPASEEPPA